MGSHSDTVIQPERTQNLFSRRQNKMELLLRFLICQKYMNSLPSNILERDSVSFLTIAYTSARPPSPPQQVIHQNAQSKFYENHATVSSHFVKTSEPTAAIRIPCELLSTGVYRTFGQSNI
jgi:hypothetical protein